MKKYLAILMFSILLVGAVLIIPKNQTQTDYLRIHIRANSNEQIDQDVKYLIKDKVVAHLTPLLQNTKTKEEAIEIIKKNSLALQKIADVTLAYNNYNYTSNICVKKEEFPSRSYNKTTLPAGVYDAVIIELGKAKGDNWWCVVFPPLCFVATPSDNIEYASKIKELINNG
ncbi:MAG: stage II sporulation protein R [Clostridia bacterium]